MMHNLTQRSLVLGLKAVCLHSIRWPFENTVLAEFNDTFEFRKITMQERSDVAQPRAQFPMPAVTQFAAGVLEVKIGKQRMKFLHYKSQFDGFLKIIIIFFPHGSSSLPSSYAEWECSIFPASNTRRFIKQDSCELVPLNPFYRRETNANYMQSPCSGVSARCTAIKFNYRGELKPSSMHSQQDICFTNRTWSSTTDCSCCLLASWLYWRLKFKGCWLLFPKIFVDLDIIWFLPVPWICR